MIQNQILFGFIASDAFVKAILPIYKPTYLESVMAKHVVRWCVDYYNKYQTTPKHVIHQLYFKALEDGLDPVIGEEIEEFILPQITETFINSGINAELLVQDATQYFTQRSLKLLNEEIQKALDEGDTASAQTLISSYTRFKAEINHFLDLSSVEVLPRVKNALNQAFLPLFHFPGALGEFLNPQLLAGGFMAFMASEKRGKCLPGTQKILMSNGEELTIKEIIKRNRKDIISFDEENQKFIKTQISNFWTNGIKDVFEITTRSGRTVQVTKNHPFLTPDGWKDLTQITEGEYIATPKEIGLFGKSKLSNIQIKLLAYFITEGCLREYNYHNGKGTYKVINFTSADLDIQKDFGVCINKMGCDVSWKGISCRVINSEKNKRKHNKNYVLNMLKKYKINNKLSYEKTIPNIIFKLPKQKLSLFLKVLFTCDGWINKGANPQIGFAVANEVLAKQVQNLLTRFGIVSTFSFRTNDKKGAWTVSIRDWENIIKYSNEIGFLYEKQEKMKEVISKSKISHKSFIDKFPHKIALQFYNDVKKELGGCARIEAGRNSKQSNFHKVFKNGLSLKGQINKKTPIMRQSFLQVRNTKAGQKYFNSPILWDEIMRIQFVGQMETFDLTVEKHHNFIAENILVHNTFWLLEIGMAAARQHKKVAFFQAGDMTEAQQIKRIATYLTKRPVDEKYLGETYEPVKDCVFNQLDTCDREERECTFGPFKTAGMEADELRTKISKEMIVEAMENYPDYKPCHNCLKYKTNRWGSPWLKKIQITDVLTPKTAVMAVKKFFIKYKREFRISTHTNGTLSVKGIVNILKAWEKDDNFVPDLILIDYADILISDAKTEFRHQQNDIWKALRGLSQAKPWLVVTVTQADAKSYEAHSLKLSNFSEDKRKYAHCTSFYGLNQDPHGREKKIGVLRINELMIREGEGLTSNEVFVLQNLKLGKPFLTSFF